MILPLVHFAAQLNELGKTGTPFFFLIDFEGLQPLVLPEKAWSGSGIRFNTPLFQSGYSPKTPDGGVILTKYPVPFAEYERRFQESQQALRRGDSFLLNLTCQTPIEINRTLEEIFEQSRAAYQLYVPGKLVVFSPECFVRIENNAIFTYPMKGTIDASTPAAEQILTDDPKEKAEHATVVDLLRNDLSQIAGHVRVIRYRYMEKVIASDREILQTSSEIRGALPAGYRERIGDLICSLLPAGSVSGAPKKRTVEWIKTVEGYDRGYYTGVFGVFDGERLDSGVLIRYIEQTAGGMIFKSGGGITALSDAQQEYEEMIRKIYVPIY